jgi:hypothetical protein
MEHQLNEYSGDIMALSGQEKDYILGNVENEGFFYAIAFYSDYKNEVTDKKFHQLRDALLKVANELAEYCGTEIHN